ncbi:ROK family protein [bacterium]|nr:ROK family protein [bacterium]
MSVAKDRWVDARRWAGDVASSSSSKPKRWAGVEGGGTTWVVAIAEGEPDRIVKRADFPTTTPEETLPQIRNWRAAEWKEGRFDSLGVATFGPVDLDRHSPTYGHITHSPKPGWEAVDVLGILKKGWCPQSLPTGFDTDVNAPAVAEYAAVQREFVQIDLESKKQKAPKSPAGKFVRALFTDGDDDDDVLEQEVSTSTSGDEETDDSSKQKPKQDTYTNHNDTLRFQNLAYVTVGTGVGVGVVCGGEPVHGLSHPEAGHIRVARLASDGLPNEPGSFQGTCVFHGDCIEGMAGAAAIAKRCGCDMSQLAQIPDDHHAWDAAAHYIAGMCCSLVMVASPQRIVLGGGVLQRKTLVTKIRNSLRTQLGGYVKHDFVERNDGLNQFLVASRHGNEAGIIGALALADRALELSLKPFSSSRKKKSVAKRLAHYFAYGVSCALVTLKIVNEEVRLRGKKAL